MEESKEIKTLNSVSDKPSYEALEERLKIGEQNFNKLRDQAQQMYQQLQEQNMFNAFKRLEFLFKVMEFAHEFKSEFVTACAEEIESTLTLPKEETKSEENK